MCHHHPSGGAYDRPDARPLPRAMRNATISLLRELWLCYAPFQSSWMGVLPQKVVGVVDSLSFAQKLSLILLSSLQIPSPPSRERERYRVLFHANNFTIRSCPDIDRTMRFSNCSRAHGQVRSPRRVSVTQVTC